MEQVRISKNILLKQGNTGNTKQCRGTTSGQCNVQFSSEGQIKVEETLRGIKESQKELKLK